MNTKSSDIEILVIGDVMLDQYIKGTVTKSAPESGAPVLQVETEDQMLGGAGNVYANLKGLQSQASLVSVVGNDDEGILIKMMVKNLGGDHFSILLDNDRPSTCKTRVIDNEKNIVRIDKESTSDITSELQDQIISEVNKHISTLKLIIVSDYSKGVVTEELSQAIISLAKKHNIPVFVDPKKEDFRAYEGATYICPNLKELSLISDVSQLDTDESVEKAALKIIETYSINTVIVTRSEKGISVIEKNKDPIHKGSLARSVSNVSGAGDTVLATFADSIVKGQDLVEAVSRANKAAAIVISQEGTSAVDLENLKTATDVQQEAQRAEEAVNIICDSVTNDKVSLWKSLGYKVGFTNGCFDILHAGHVSYLGLAREKCDRLIVAINADESVKRLKGQDRPVNGEQERLSVISSLRAVDHAVLFGKDVNENDMPIEIIKKIKPDIIFKGGDYAIDDLPEAKVVLAYGGEVELMPVYEGQSTTGTINKLKGQAA